MAAVKLAEDRLGYTQLTAPFDGEVVNIFTQEHEVVIAKQPISKIVNRSKIEFSINVPEQLIGYANRVVSTIVRFDVQPDTPITATVKEIGREASTGTRTYPVTLILEKTSDFEILPGMAGNVTISSQLPETAIQSGLEIPATAVFSKGDKANSFVWLVVDGKTQQQAINIGLPTAYGVLIKSGLKSGDQIIVAGVNSLTESQAVAPLPASRNK